MPYQRGINCSIESHGNVCEEFETEDSTEMIPVASFSSDTTVCRYVCLPDASEFRPADTVNQLKLGSWSNSTQQDCLLQALLVRTLMDGRCVDVAVIIVQTHCRTKTPSEAAHFKYERVLVTGKLDCATEGSADVPRASGDVGTIKVVYRKCYCRVLPQNEILPSNTHSTARGPMYRFTNGQMTKHGLPHATEISTRSSPIWIEAKDEAKRPFAVFLFLYRPESMSLY